MTVIGWAPCAPKVRPTRKSFHTPVTIRISATTTMLPDIGRTISKKIRQKLPESITAAAISSCGMVRKKLRKMSVRIGIESTTCTIATPKVVPYTPKVAVARISGYMMI